MTCRALADTATPDSGPAGAAAAKWDIAASEFREFVHNSPDDELKLNLPKAAVNNFEWKYPCQRVGYHIGSI
jgi:hypothetical protein